MQEILQAISDILHKGGRGAMATVIETSGSAPQSPGARMVLGPDGGQLGTVGGGAIEHRILEALRECKDGAAAKAMRIDLGELGMCCGGQMTVFIEPIDSPQILVIFGAGHVGKATASMARAVGFSVTIVDDRGDLNTEERFPGCRRILASVEDAGALLPGPKDPGGPDAAYPWFLIMTHDHGLDEVALEACINRPHGYVGLIGSQRKVFRILRSMATRAPLPSMDRLFAPVGLDLGGSSPEELAVSIVAELVALRHGRPANHLRLMNHPLLTRVVGGEVALEAAVEELRGEQPGGDRGGPKMSGAGT